MKNTMCFFIFSLDSDFSNDVVQHLVNFRDFYEVNLNDYLLSEFDASVEPCNQSVVSDVIENDVNRQKRVVITITRAKELMQAGLNIVMTGLRLDDLQVQGTDIVELVLIEKNEHERSDFDLLEIFNRYPALHMQGVEDDETAKFFMDRFMVDFRGLDGIPKFYGAA